MKNEQRKKRDFPRRKTSLPGGARYEHNDAADFLGITPGTLAKWRSIGRPFIPYYKIGRKVVYLESDLRDFLGLHRIGANVCG